MSKHQKVAMAVAAVLVAYFVYRKVSGAGSATSSTTPTGSDPAAADYAAAAGQEQSDVAQLQGQEQSDVAALAGQEQTDIGNLQAGLLGLGATLSGQIAGVSQPPGMTKAQQRELNKLAAGEKGENRHKTAHHHRKAKAATQRKQAQRKAKSQRTTKHTHASPNVHVAPNHHGPKPATVGTMPWRPGKVVPPALVALGHTHPAAHPGRPSAPHPGHAEVDPHAGPIGHPMGRPGAGVPGHAPVHHQAPHNRPARKRGR